jgi:hypothetical protein
MKLREAEKFWSTGVHYYPLVIFFPFDDGWAGLKGFSHYFLKLICGITGKPNNIIILDKFIALFR